MCVYSLLLIKVISILDNNSLVNDVALQIFNRFCFFVGLGPWKLEQEIRSLHTALAIQRANCIILSDTEVQLPNLM